MEIVAMNPKTVHIILICSLILLAVVKLSVL